MKRLLFILSLVVNTSAFAADLPWQPLETPYPEYAGEASAPWSRAAMPMLTVEQSRYDLRIVEQQAIGTITLAGNALAAFPQPMQLFGSEVAVLDVIVSDNALLTASDGAYAVYPQEPGVFLLMLAVSIPIYEFEAGPRLEFEVPAAVRNELVLETPEHLRLLDSEVLHKVGERYFFAPTRFLDLGFEYLDRIEQVPQQAEQLWVLNYRRTPEQEA